MRTCVVKLGKSAGTLRNGGKWADLHNQISVNTFCSPAFPSLAATSHWDWSFPIWQAEQCRRCRIHVVFFYLHTHFWFLFDQRVPNFGDEDMVSKQTTPMLEGRRVVRGLLRSGVRCRVGVGGRGVLEVAAKGGGRRTIPERGLPRRVGKKGL